MDMSLRELSDMPDDAAIVSDDGQTLRSKASMLEQLGQQMQSVRAGVIAQRDEWVRYRASTGVEDRWRRCALLYSGQDAPDSTFVETLKTGPMPQKKGGEQQANRSRVVVNIVRPKVDQAIARMCDILLPVDDKNWGIRQTPVPDNIKSMLGDNRVTVLPGTNTPNPDGATADQEAQEAIQQSRACAEKMEKTIDDQLNECSYNGEQRAAITDGVKLGTAVMLGPFPAKQTSKVWSQGQLNYNERTVPASVHADPWDVWFDPAAGPCHQNGAGFWHKRLVTRKQIRALKGVLGFDTTALSRVLDTSPSRVTQGQSRVVRNNVAKEQAYEMWTYHGELEPDQVTLMTQTTGDELKDVDFGVVMLINDEVVGVMKSWIADKTLPVDVWNWREADDSPFGFGMPDDLEHQQRVITSAWRQVMDNARFSVGSQIVFLDGVTPADGTSGMQVYPGKLWRCDPEKITDVRMAMAAVDFPSHLQDLLAIADKAMEYADSESGIPQIVGGEQGSAPETLGGTVMLYNNAQSVLRLRVKLYDDDMTRPHLGRYYDWNMANSKDESIKGDMEVDARGSTALLEKDIQNQATLNLANVTSNPRYAAFLDPKEELKMILKAFKVQPETIMASDDQIKKNLEAPPPEDPRLFAAKATLEAKKLDIQDRQADRQADAVESDHDRRAGAADRLYNQQREQGEYEIAMTTEQNKRDLQGQKIASDERQAAATLEVNTGIKHLEIDTKRQLFNAEAALRVRTGEGI